MKQVAVRTFKLLFLTIGLIVVTFLFLGVIILGQIPSSSEIKGCLVTKMYKVNLCPDTGKYTPYKQISPYLVKAVVLTEDSAFWQHNGFDFTELQRSLETNLKRGRYARGGSTISQQLAKNLFLTTEKTMLRKGLEALITMRLEKVLTKKEILEKYLNVVQFGPDIFGVKQAAQFYFKKSPSQLNVVESAFLAFLLPSPEKYSKSFFKKQLTPFARNRLLQIVNRLYKFQRISASEYQNARVHLAGFLGGVPMNVGSEMDDMEEGDLMEGDDWMDLPPPTDGPSLDPIDPMSVNEPALEFPQSESPEQQQDQEE